MDRPVLLCGLGRVGWRILDLLRAAGVTVVVVDLKADPKDPRLETLTFVQGDGRKADVLERVGVKHLAAAIVVTSDDLVNVTAALTIRRLNPSARIVVRMFNQNLIKPLGQAVKNVAALSVSALTAPLLAQTAITGHAVTFVKMDGPPRQIAEAAVEPGSALIGQTLNELAAKYHLSVLAHSRGANSVAFWPDAATKLEAGDLLLACGESESISRVLSVGRDELLGTVRWAGWIRRQFRTLARTLAVIDRPVKFATAALVIALLASTLVFRFGFATSWADGFYQTVGLVATGGELHGEARPAWAKTFLGAMKLLGTALIAAFTAIFTQYLLRARLGGALEARRIPDGGHILVCGLGNVGFRCVEELVRQELPVVAINLTADNPFVSTVRRMGVPVILGNATVAAVLAQARAASAGAVIAATDSELSNLEIALLVHEANPKQRVVVRLNEADFAAAVRESAQIRHAISTPALAASAFAAALFGDHVQALVSFCGKTLAVLDLAVQSGEKHLCGIPIADLTAELRMKPLALNRKPIVDPGANLSVGDVLTVLIELGAMEQINRR